MSEATRIVTPEVMTDQDLLIEAVHQLQEEGVADIFTAKQWQQQKGHLPTAHFYFAHNTKYNKAAGAEREGEELSVVLNTSWADVAGISAKDGMLIGGVHRLETPENEQSPTEIAVINKLKQLRRAYNGKKIEQALEVLSDKIDGSVSQVSYNHWEIHVNGSLNDLL